ncbi:MAG: sulfurtransferase TusA family protein [Anaerolineae bacterium]|nr:sulfurtransferase TusA family protein [Anaerolineae bacterium]
MTEIIRADDSFATNLEICFEVLLYLASRMAALHTGQSLEFITSDPEAGDKIPTWVETREFALLEHETLPDGRQRFLIRK